MAMIVLIDGRANDMGVMVLKGVQPPENALPSRLNEESTMIFEGAKAQVEGWVDTIRASHVLAAFPWLIVDVDTAEVWWA